jgi:hypothetical protein
MYGVHYSVQILINFVEKFSKNIRINFLNNQPVTVEGYHAEGQKDGRADGQTDKTKLKAILRTHQKEEKNRKTSNFKGILMKRCGSIMVTQFGRT